MANPITRPALVPVAFGATTISVAAANTVLIAEDMLRHGLIKDFTSKNRDSATMLVGAAGVTLS